MKIETHQATITGNGDVNELTQKLRDHLKELEEKTKEDNVVPFIDPKKLH